MMVFRMVSQSISRIHFDSYSFVALNKFGRYAFLSFACKLGLYVLQIGTIGGNLMIKHQHIDFQSDVFLLLETVGACLTICKFIFYSLLLTIFCRNNK